MESLEKLLDGFPSDTPATITDALVKANAVLDRYEHPVCSVSGGADSDIMMDIIHRVDPERKTKYIWFDTGVEWQATKNHIAYLEYRYDTQIERIKAIKPIPVCCKEYGQPFISKVTSQLIHRLQQHGFQWEDEPYEVLVERYPGCASAIGWWTNHRDTGKFKESQFNINSHRYLKEFMILNPPTFPISDKCCTYAKKNVSKEYIKTHDVDLMITGVRKTECGIRAASYKSCWTQYDDECDTFRPVFWFTQSDKEIYSQIAGIVHSDCYTVWGFKRTGCVGCPFNKHHLDEITIAGKYEPRLEQAARNIFKDTYDYTARFREFAKMMKQKERDAI